MFAAKDTGVTQLLFARSMDKSSWAQVTLQHISKTHSIFLNPSSCSRSV